MSGAECGGESERRRRGRPRGFDVDAALDRAIAVFSSRGYAGAGISELTAAMGLSPPSVYAAFGDKRGLFLAALGRYGATEGSAPLEALRGEGPLGERLQAFLQAAVALAHRDGMAPGCLAACVGGDAAGCDPAIRDRLHAQMSAAEAALEAAAGPGGPSGRMLLAAQIAIAVRARAGASRADSDALAAELLRHFARGAEPDDCKGRAPT